MNNWYITAIIMALLAVLLCKVLETLHSESKSNPEKRENPDVAILGFMIGILVITVCTVVYTAVRGVRYDDIIENFEEIQNEDIVRIDYHNEDSHYDVEFYYKEYSDGIEVKGISFDRIRITNSKSDDITLTETGWKVRLNIPEKYVSNLDLKNIK